jgi:hypothetical protein
LAGCLAFALADFLTARIELSSIRSVAPGFPDPTPFVFVYRSNLGFAVPADKQGGKFICREVAQIRGFRRSRSFFRAITFRDRDRLLRCVIA